MKEQRLFDFRDELLKAEKAGTIPFKIYDSMYYSIDAAKKDYNLEAFYLQTLIENENNIKDGIKKDGLTDEQIEAIINEGKYIRYSKAK